MKIYLNTSLYSSKQAGTGKIIVFLLSLLISFHFADEYVYPGDGTTEKHLNQVIAKSLKISLPCIMLFDSTRNIVRTIKKGRRYKAKIVINNSQNEVLFDEIQVRIVCRAEEVLLFSASSFSNKTQHNTAGETRIYKNKSSPFCSSNTYAFDVFFIAAKTMLTSKMYFDIGIYATSRGVVGRKWLILHPVP